MISAYLEKYRALVALLVVLAAFAVGVAVGGAAGTWRAESGFSAERSACASKRLELSEHIAVLERSIVEQNASVQAIKAKADEAKRAQKKAEEYAGKLAEFSASRMKKLEAAITDSCDGVMSNYWELRK